MQKKYGEGSIYLGSEFEKHGFHHFSTGCAALDIVLCGGWAHGRHLELSGPEGSGKTTIACLSAAAYQREVKDGVVTYLDAENALDAALPKECGVDLGRFFVLQPATGEEAGDAVKKLMNEHEGHMLIIVDSVPALVPLSEQEDEIGKAGVAVQARLVSKILRVVNTKLRRKPNFTIPPYTVMFLNQLRTKIGVLYGDPMDTAGGVALKYYKSQAVRLTVTKVLRKSRGRLSAEGEAREAKFALGKRIGFNVIKNKARGPEGETGEFRLWFGARRKRRGIVDNAISVYQYAKLFDLVTGRIPKYTPKVVAWKGKTKWKSEAELLQELREDDDLYYAIYEECLAASKRIFLGEEEV